MSKIIIRCKYCKKQVEAVSEYEAFSKLWQRLTCGHSVVKELVVERKLETGHKLVCKECFCDVDDIRQHINTFHVSVSTDIFDWVEKNLISIPTHRHASYAALMNFQQSGVDFIERSNFNCAILDEMGLGKTAQALVASRHYKDKLCPIIFVVKAALRINWLNEMITKRWLCDGFNDPMDLPQVVMDGQSMILPGFKYYIVGMNLLTKYESELSKLGAKLIVIDESQNFSNIQSKRTQALMNIARNIPHRICLSGTPILNRASEFFTTLNLIKPEHWSNYKSFVWNWIEIIEEPNAKGKMTRRMRGIKPWRLEEFHSKTSHYILRRMKRDVLKDLPKFKRDFVILENQDSAVKQAYNKTAQDLDDYMHSEQYEHDSGFDRNNKMLAYLVRMRHLCGIAKVPLIVEEIKEFLESTKETDTKLIVGCHHDEVMRQLKLALDPEYNPVILSSGLDNIEREARIAEFRNGRRLCLAKILAQGEGLNLQFCHSMFVTERQWNPGKEEQFEARIDRYGQTEPTTAQYFIMKNTVDETFTDMVEEKRKLCGETLNEDYDYTMDSKIIQFLAERSAKLRM